MFKCSLLWRIAALVGLGTSPLAADIFLLSNGGRVEGQLLNPDQSPRESYVVGISDGGRVTLGKAQVNKVVSPSEAERRYQELLPRMPQTADGHWKMAEWCRQNRLSTLRQFHLEQVLLHDAEHKEARYGLGYSRVDGKWLRAEERMRSQGYVRHQGEWRLPQEILLGEGEEDVKQQEIQWRQRLKVWRSWVVKRRGKEVEGLKSIQAIREVTAAPALVELLADKDEPAQLKLLYIDVLGRLPPSRPGTAALIQRALQDQDKRVRERCLDELARRGSEQAASVFIKTLQHKDNRLVNRAAVGLARMKSPRATLPLIEALTTRHKFVVNSGGGLGATFGQGGGGGGLTAGGGPKLIEQDLQNDSVLSALTSLHPGGNFAYDKESWKRWYAQQHTSQAVNLRRD